jgi:DNA recombination protein RmuC
MTNLEWVLIILCGGLFSLAGFLVIRLYRAQLELQQARALTKTDADLLEKFKSLSHQTLEGQSQQFLQLAKTTLEKENVVAKSELEKRKIEIEHVVEPLKKKLEEYQQQLQGLERERQRSYTQVENELKKVVEVGNTLNLETTALKNALKKPHVRGRWGEVQLKNCVELSGMSEYADVTFQDSTTMEDGARLIPDMTVRMPGGRVVIVDAKTPIDAFLSSLEAPDDEKRATELARHGRHVKDHIKKLATKGYGDQLKNAADFTVMFLPNESFLYAALEVEADLVEFAIQRKILIATPPTLIGLLKVIRFGWNEERLAENAQRISDVGIELHKRLVDFVEGFVSIGKHLEKAKAEYDTGLARLESRVITQVKRLEQLGAKSVKSLPANIADQEVEN